MTALLNGIHVLSVRAYDNEGASRELGTRTVQVINNGQNLAPFGVDRLPARQGVPHLRDAEQLGRLPLALHAGNLRAQRLLQHRQRLGPRRGLAPRRGPGLLRGAPAGRPDHREHARQLRSARPGPDQLLRHQPAGRGAQLLRATSTRTTRASLSRSSCSGFRPTRPGTIAIYIPTGTGTNGQNTELVGFTNPGKHTLAIRAGDEEETVTQFGAMSVDVLCDQVDGDQPAFGYIDTPSNYQFINGSFEVFGWAFDLQGVRSVEVDVDGQVAGQRELRPLPPRRPGQRPARSVRERRVLLHPRHDPAVEYGARPRHLRDRQPGQPVRDRPPQVRGRQRHSN